MLSRGVKCFSRCFQAQALPHHWRLQLYKAEKTSIWTFQTSSMPPAGRSSGLLLERAENNCHTDAAHIFLNTDHHHYPACRCTAQTSDETSEMLGIFSFPRGDLVPLALWAAKSLKAEWWKKPEGAPSVEEHWLWSDSSGPAPARKQRKKNHR